MYLKRSQLKCKENLKLQNITLDFGGLEIVVFIIDPKTVD